MATFTIRNVPENVKQAWRVKAAQSGRSLEETLRALLAEQVNPSSPPAPGTGDEEIMRAAAGPDSGEGISGKRILLVIGGGIAAYKCLDLIRRLRERGARVRCVMTEAAQHFVTPLAVGAVSADHVFSELFDRQAEHDIGHIRLSREADLLVVAPATADLMAKMANGLARPAGHRQEGADRAGDEPAHVGTRCDAQEPRNPGRRRG